MPKGEINIPEHLEMRITRLIDRGEFVNREEAFEALISAGIKAYEAGSQVPAEEELAFEGEGMMDHEDEYVF
ncbi:MAG: DUF7120 family protein [Halobacteriota archaeon]